MPFLLALFSPERVEAWVTWGGSLVIFALLFACGLGFPLPEDIPLLIGGYFVGQGKMHLAVLAVLAWCGIIGGDCCLYFLSRRYGLNVTRLPLVGRHVTEKRILWAEQKFERYGIWVVATCRMIAGVRGAMVIAAGAIRFNFLKFIIADGLAAIVSGGLFVYLGYLAGKHFGSIEDVRARIKHYEHYVIIGAVVVILIAIAYFFWRHRRLKAELSEEDARRANGQSAPAAPGAAERAGAS
jgi:membrane protein DedA with SNARE-associated domain